MAGFVVGLEGNGGEAPLAVGKDEDDIRHRA